MCEILQLRSSPSDQESRGCANAWWAKKGWPSGWTEGWVERSWVKQDSRMWAVGPGSPFLCSGRPFVDFSDLAWSNQDSWLMMTLLSFQNSVGTTRDGARKGAPAFCQANLCVPLSPGLSTRHHCHGPAPPHCGGPSRAARCPDHRHRVRTEEAEEKEDLLHLPTEDQYVWANQSCVLWQSMSSTPQVGG